jgi:SPW repeat
MRFLSTRIHGVMDYAMGILLLASPYLFGFATGGVKQWLPMILGVAMIGMSLLTRYEWGAIRMIPMPVHLAVDGLSGALLAVSPWLFGFSGVVFLPHLVLGLIELGTSLMTETHSDMDDTLAARI